MLRSYEAAGLTWRVFTGALPSQTEKTNQILTCFYPGLPRATDSNRSCRCLSWGWSPVTARKSWTKMRLPASPPGEETPSSLQWPRSLVSPSFRKYHQVQQQVFNPKIHRKAWSFNKLTAVTANQKVKICPLQEQAGGIYIIISSRLPQSLFWLFPAFHPNQLLLKKYVGCEQR